MLGKLFKSKSFQNIGQNSQAPANGTNYLHDSTSEAGSFEDAYTREILYGSQDVPLHPMAFKPRRFRLIVSQDGGNLRSKQVLYDSAAESSGSPSSRASAVAVSVQASDPQALSVQKLSSTANGHNIRCMSQATSSSLSSPASTSSTSLTSPANGLKVSKSIHNVNDLNDYMFGRGLPSNEKNASMKIHLLPHFNSVHGSFSAVLITKLFSILDPSSANHDLDVHQDPDWCPMPTFPTKDAYFHLPCPVQKPGYSVSDSELQHRSSLNSRFSVGVIIPLEDPNETVEEVLASNWRTMSHFLIVLQKLVTKKLILALKASIVHNVCPYINHKRISFPAGALQSDTDLSHQLQKLIKLVHYNLNTPRLINIHGLMKYEFDHPKPNFKPNAINWALEVVNWLEYKDGRNFIPPFSHMSGLSSNIHSSSPGTHSYHQPNPWHRANESPSLSNTFLASLFALVMPYRNSLSAGPLQRNFSTLKETKNVTRIVVMTSNSSVAKKLIFILNGLVPDTNFMSELESQLPNALENFPSNRTIFSFSKTATEKESSPEMNNSSITDNAPFSSAISRMNIRADNSHLQGEYSSRSGLVQPIPIRKSSSISEEHSDGSPNISLSSNKGWEVCNKPRPSITSPGIGKAPETASVTVARQIPSARRVSASNPSSMTYLSSSLNSSLSSSASNYSLSRFGSSFMEKWKTSFIGSNKLSGTNFIAESVDDAITPDVLNAGSAFVPISSPSPAYEADEPIWEDSFSSSTSVSPSKHRYSRTQSFMNLRTKTLDRSHIQTGSGYLIGANRTRTSIFIPAITSPDNAPADELNSKIIEQKVKKLMHTKLNYHISGKQGLKVDPVDQLVSSDLKEQIGERLCKRVFLEPTVAFVDEFRPEYAIQSCPVNPRVESQAMAAMKNDLMFYQNNCGYENVTSTTILVSLRAREIKLIEMKVRDKKQHVVQTKPSQSQSTPVTPNEESGTQLTSPSPHTDSPTSSYFNHMSSRNNTQEQQNTGNNTVHTSIKKVYSPSKNSGEKELIQRIESQLEKLTEVASLINNSAEQSADTKENYSRMLLNAIRDIIV